MINNIYNKDVIKLAADISGLEQIDNACSRISLRSPLCGSSIEVAIVVKDTIITGYSQKITACALGQASASIMASAVKGKSRNNIITVRDQVKVMLNSGVINLERDWIQLACLAPAREAKARHGAILLPFDAVLKAFGEWENN